MIDFKQMSEEKQRLKASAEIISKLDEIGLPWEGELTWERIHYFGKTFGDFNFGNTLPPDQVSVETLLPVIDFVLSEDQERAWEKLVVWVNNNDPYFILRGYAGTGKEQPIRCKVQTQKGTKKLKHIKIGDKIYGSQGQLVTVTGKYPQGNKDCYKITFRDKVSTYCGLDHLWSIVDKHGRSRIITTKFLLDNELKNSAGYKYRIPICKPINYEKKKLPLHPYFMGVLLGDGCFRGTTLSLSVASFDLDILKKIKTLEKRFIFTERSTSENCFQYNIVDSIAYTKNNPTNRFKDIISLLGLLNLKSGNKFIPKDYLLSSIEDRWELLRGLMDTDGSGHNNGGASFSTTSQQLREDIKILIQSLGGLAVMHDIYGKDRNDWNINVKTFENPFSLKRKADKWRLSKINLPVRSITNVEYVGKEKQVCISVDANDKLYLTDNFIVTHNTFLMKKLKDLNKTLFFTAPTNKATKVLSRFVEEEARTTFSQLGLRMSADDEELKMEYGANKSYLPKGSILVVDEASMIGRQLYQFIEETRQRTGCKVLYVGDPAQLPPVGEKRTKSWNCTKDKENIATLRKVMRYDNQLLNLATHIRDLMKNRDYDVYPIEHNAEDTGVFLLASKKQFIKQITKWDKPEDYFNRKAIAWRNKTVTSYNNIVREKFGFEDPYNTGDIVLLAEPIEKNDVIIAHIDDEFQVKDVKEVEVKTSCKNLIPCYSLRIENEDNTLLIHVPKDREDLDDLLARKAGIARGASGPDKRDAWKDFWDTKKQFAATRYGYSITAHRAQGSSYEEVYVDQHDILSNQNKREAWKCLYVSVTRAQKSVYTY